jgi:hypothetical protein
MDFKKFISQTSAQPNHWKGKSEDVIRSWQDIVPNQPIQMMPVSKQHKGTKFQEDGIRLTGSSNFINSVLSRLKDVLKQTLNVEYRELQNKTGVANIGKKYVFYAHAIQK